MGDIGVWDGLKALDWVEVWAVGGQLDNMVRHWGRASHSLAVAHR